MSHNELAFYGLVILLFLLMSAFFSAAETALTAVTRARIYQLVMDNNRRARIVSRLRRDKESLITTVLLANTAVNVAASALATSVALRILGNSDMGLLIVTGIMTALMVIFAEILPKTYAIQNAERAALALSPALSLIIKLLLPVTRTIQVLIRILLRMCGVRSGRSDTLISSTDVIRGTIELHHREGTMIKQDRDMLGSILDLNDIEVRNVMVHRTQVETIDANLPPGELIRKTVSTMHSRIPLWRGQPDNIIGVLHVKNLIQAMGKHREPLDGSQILAICNKPWFVPDTTNLRDQLLAFRSKRQHIAFVVDEYGAWQGIITLEDIIEEIVGDIDDEHDEADNDIQKIGNDAYSVVGNVTVRDLNRQLDWNLPDEEASTIAGLLIHEAEAIPAVGEHFNIHGFRFTVMEKAAAQVTRLRIEKLPDTELPGHVEI